MKNYNDNNLKEALHLYAEKMNKEFPTDEEVADVKFSADFEQRMDNIVQSIAILSVIYLPDMMISPDKSNTAEDMNMAGGVENSSGFIYTSFEITSTKVAKSDTDKQNIENIYNIIQSAFADNDYSDDAEQETADKIEFPQEQKPSTQKGESALKGDENYSTDLVEFFSKGVTYTLTFAADNGQKKVYTLCDNILTNEATNESVTVIEDQLKDLYTKVFTVTYGKE